MVNTRDFYRALTAVLIALVLAACGRSDPASLVESAKSYLAKGDAKAAIIQLKNALQEAPNNADARFLLAKSLLETGDPVAAETEVRKALDLKYSGDEAYPLLARALLQQGEYRKVVTDLADRKLASPLAQAEVLTAIGQAHLGLGEKKEAREAIAAALAAKPGDPRAILAQAQLAAADNDLPAAMKLVETALASTPDDVTALLLKAELEIAQERRDDGIKTLERALQIKPDLLAARFMLVAVLAQSGQAERAAAQLEPAKKALPQDPRTIFSEAIIAYASGDMTAARDAIQRVLSVAPDHVPSVYLSGLVNYRLGSYAAAEEALRKVVVRFPDDIGARRTLAATYLRTGRTAQALEALEPALQKAPDDPPLLRAMAEIYLASNQPAKAAELYERATTLDTGNVAGRVRLAQVRLATGGDTARALKDLEALAEANPTLPAADLALISAHLRRREMDQALAAASAFEKKQPTNPLVYNVKGVIYVSKRDYKSARASFDQALQVDPGFAAAAYNLAQLDLMQRNADGARKRYEQMLTTDSKNEQALLALAALLVATNAPQAETKAAFERAITANPNSLRARLALINYYGQQRDGKGALAAAQAAQSAMPDNPQLLETLGVAQQAAGEGNQARETLTRAVKLQPQNAMTLLRLAGVEASLKDYDAAIASLRKAVAAKPDLPAGWLALASVYVVAGRVDAGFADARKLQKELPGRAAGFALEGNLFLSQKKWPEAAAAFREGLVREPIPALSANLYSTLQAAGKQDQATVMAQRWQKEHPQDTLLRTLQGQQALLAKDYRTAAQHLRAVVDLDPNNIAALNNLAWSLNELGDPKAIEYAEQAASLAPYAPSVMDTQGWILVRQGSSARGLELLRTASRLAPQDTDIRLHFAKALLKSGDKAAAKTELEKLALETKASPARTEAQQMLNQL